MMLTGERHHIMQTCPRCGERHKMNAKYHVSVRILTLGRGRTRDQLDETHRTRKVSGATGHRVGIHRIVDRRHDRYYERVVDTVDLDTVDPGDHQIENDRVVVVLGRHRERIDAVRRDVDRVPVLTKATTHRARNLRFVLDHEDPHLAIPVTDALMPVLSLSRTT